MGNIPIDRKRQYSGVEVMPTIKGGYATTKQEKMLQKAAHKYGVKHRPRGIFDAIKALLPHN
jgi:CHASE1-domain containing sensor protein